MDLPTATEWLTQPHFAWKHFSVPPRRLFTVAEYERMTDPRIFPFEERTELLQGVVVNRHSSRPWLFSREAYHALAECGILHANEHTELIEGEILLMSPINARHAGLVNRLNLWVVATFVGRAMPAIQNPVQLGEGSEPQPDVAVLKPRRDLYARAHPSPQDVLWLMEVSDTTLEYDCDIKVPLYARAGIPEVWVVDVNNARVLVYRHPKRGGYSEQFVVERGQTLGPLVFPETVAPVTDLLGDSDD